MRTLYVKCGAGTPRGAASHVLYRVGEGPPSSLVSIVFLPDDDFRALLWELPSEDPSPYLLLEEMIAGEMSVLVQIRNPAKIVESLFTIGAESHTSRP